MSDVADQLNVGDFESTVPEIGLNSWMEGVVVGGVVGGIIGGIIGGVVGGIIGGVVGGVVVDFGTYI